jgi:uncharacterized protein (TIGR03067 family)
MHRRAFVILIVGLLIGGNAGDDAVRKDLEKFEGTWTLVSAERDGKKTPQEEAMKLKLSINGSNFTLRKDSEVVSEGSMRINPGKMPKQLDETITTGPNKGKTYLAIYEIDDEHHKVCFAVAGKDRPTEFVATPGIGQLLQVWKRDKK